MRIISLEEASKNLSKYIELSKTEDIYISSNDEVVAVLKGADQEALKTASFLSLAGKYQDYDYERYLDERDSAR